MNLILSKKIGLCKALVSSKTSRLIITARIPSVNGYKYRKTVENSIYGMRLIIH